MQPYHVIKGYLTREQCAPLAKYFTENEDYDPREFYGFIGLGGPSEFFGTPPKKFSYDPDDILVNMVHFAYNFFLENYEMKGTFGLNRSHANFMHEGALLNSHHDDRDYRKEDIDSLNSMTYVCGLFLSDDYEGGELVFEEQGETLKPSVGDLVLFPGFYTRHGVNKVTSGTRLNILTHFFDVIDTSIEYKPDYAISPER